MKKWLFAWGVLILLFGALAYSQTTETFSSYVAGLPSATTPLAPGDTLYVLQGGLSKQVANNNLILPCPTATSSVLGCVKPDGVTITATPGGVISSTGGGGGGGTNLGWVIATAAPFNATGNGTTDDTAAIQAAIDFAATNGISTVYLPKPASCYKTTTSLYLDPPTNLRVNFANPPSGAFSLGLIGEPGTTGNHEDGFGSKICPSFGGSPYLIVGTGQGMKVANITIRGLGGLQAAAYRCGRIPTGGPGPASAPETGIYIAGGGAGSTRALVDQVMIENAYYGIAIGLNNGALGDSNSFRKIYMTNTCTGIEYGSSQNFINDCIECVIGSSNVGVDQRQGGGMTIVGGNWSAGSGLATGVMTLSGYSAITATSIGGNFDYSFTATLSAPAFDGTFSTNYQYGDVVSSGGQVWWCLNFSPACKTTTPSLGTPSSWEPIANYVPTILNAWAIVTTHYGVIPMTVTSFTQATGSITFKLWTPWSIFYWPAFNAVTNGDLTTEIQAVSAVYASEWVTVFKGAGLNITGTHVENPFAPTQFLVSDTFLNGSAANIITDVRFNFNPIGVGNLTGTPQEKARAYIARSFPLMSLNSIPTAIRGSALNVVSTDPVVIDINGFSFSGKRFQMDGTNFLYNPMVIRFYSNGGLLSFPGSGQPLGGSGLGYGQFETPPFTSIAQGSAGFGNDGPSARLNIPHWGVRPAPINTSCITTAQFTAISGALPTFTYTGGNGSFGYPFIYGGQLYGLCDSIVGVQTHYLFESTHHYYSIGQNLTTTNVPGLSWNYKGQGAWVYADANTLGLMFAGLGVILNDGSSDIQYLVTGVWPNLGYFTVVRADSGNGGQLSGSKTAVITGTLIKQEAYSLVFP